MPFTPEQNERITAALNQRLGGQPECPLCHQRGGWLMGPGYLSFVFSDHPNTVPLDGLGVTLILIACMHCGDTHFLNAAALGLLGPIGQPLES
jgi:hypothetical protein